MNIDVPAILTILALVSGGVWAVIVIYYKKIAKDRSMPGKGGLFQTYEIAKFLFPIFAVVLIVRGFLVEPFQIPSGSMLPTLEAGDFILVNKFSYGLRLPLGHQKFLDLGSPERGDVIVFRYPEDPSIDYIKRVIGIPGDKIRYQNKQLFINGEPVPLMPLDTYEKNRAFVELEEKLGELTHHILLSKNYNNMSQVIEVEVPEGKYFALGDNRDNSRDSRYWGFVPDENLKGRAFLIWLHKAEGEWPSQWSRIGTIIE